MASPGSGSASPNSATRNRRQAPATPAPATDCRTRNFIAKFEITVAFDAAPVPVSSSAPSLPVGDRTGADHLDENSSEEGSEEEARRKAEMKLRMSSTNVLIAAVVLVAVLVGGVLDARPEPEERRSEGTRHQGRKPGSRTLPASGRSERGRRSARRVLGRLPAAGLARKGRARRRRHALADRPAQPDRQTLAREIRDLRPRSEQGGSAGSRQRRPAPKKRRRSRRPRRRRR